MSIHLPEQPTETGLPHSGNAPEGMRELPVEILNTTLAQDVSEGLVTMPGTSEPFTTHETATQPSTKPEVQHTGLRGFLDKPLGKLAAGGLVLLTAGGAAWAALSASNASTTPKPIPAATGEANTPSVPDILPSEAPSETAAPSPEPLPAELANLAGKEPAEFASNPKLLQRQYAVQLMTTLTQGHNDETLAGFEDGYYSMSKDSRDKLPVATETNNMQEIVTLDAANNRFSIALKGSDRNNLLIALHHDGIDSPAYNVMASHFDKNPEGMTGTALGYRKGLPVDIAQSETGILIDANNEKYDDITTKSQIDGSISTTRYFLVKVPLSNGTTYLTWSS